MPDCAAPPPGFVGSLPVSFVCVSNPPTEQGPRDLLVTDPWGTTIRLTEGLDKVAGVTPYTYIDGFVAIDQKQ